MPVQPRTMVFVPGAWHSAASFDVLIDTLKAGGYAGETVTLELPSVGPQPGSPVLSSMLPDIETVQSVVSAEIERGNSSILLVAHSYGSVPAACALESFTDSTASDIKFVILAGMMLRHGESLLDVCGGAPPPLWRIEGDVVFANDPEHNFYNDLPEDVQRLMATKLKPHSYATKKAPATFEGWASVPTTYIGCLKDNAIPVPLQELFLSRAKEQGVNITYETIDSGHTPMIGRPEQLANMLLELASS